MTTTTTRTALVLITLISSVACSSGADEPYKAAPAFSGRKASLPSVPPLPTTPVKVGDAYSIYGAIHHLRSRYHDKDVSAKDITIQGYIVESNIPTAPPCSVHPTGKKDPENCKDVPIPSFYIADNKGDTQGQKIRVLGWAKNFASVYDAMQKYKGLKDKPKELVKDDMLQVDVPFPLPAVGAKVKITGTYGYSFSRLSTGIVVDSQNGVFTYKSMETVEPAPEPAAFSTK